MSQIRVTPVRGYDDEEGIHCFVRDALHMNPDIASLLESGDASRLVVVKPNWVQEAHEHKPNVWEPVITHPNILTAIVEELAALMRGRGTIALCDAPHTYADFPAILARGALMARLGVLRERFPELDLAVLDLRREIWIRKEGVIVERRPNTPDPRGYARVDIGRDSMLYGHRGEGRYYGADYDTGEVNVHHHGDVHEYLLSGTAMACDLFVNVPKLKTHKKTGITCCLKNLVGINGDKNWLPHHTEGAPHEGGDEFPDESLVHTIERSAKRVLRQMALRLPGLGTWMFRKARNMGIKVLGDSDTILRNGNWRGNDTCWRMVLDLNRALLYGDAGGNRHVMPAPKRYLAIVDGILGGQGNGPLCPDAVDSGILVAGTNPAEVDAAACRLMGFDPTDFPVVARAFDAHPRPIASCALDAVTVRDDRVAAAVPLSELKSAVPVDSNPISGGRGHLEGL